MGFKIHKYTQGDIIEYTLSELSSALTENEFHAQAVDIRNLPSQVSVKSSVVFIWVRLVVKELLDGLLSGTPVRKL